MPWINMRNAYESREEFDSRGRCLKRERMIGPSVPRMIIILVVAGLGAGAAKLPPDLVDFFRNLP